MEKNNNSFLKIGWGLIIRNTKILPRGLIIRNGGSIFLLTKLRVINEYGCGHISTQKVRGRVFKLLPMLIWKWVQVVFKNANMGMRTIIPTQTLSITIPNGPFGKQEFEKREFVQREF